MPQPCALVLGGGGGIGAAIARRLAPQYAVAIGYQHHSNRADAVAAELASQGRQAVTVGADVSTEAGITAAFDAAEELGPLACVVHCVGGWSYPRLTDLSLDHINEILTLNLTSALLTLRESARRVRPDGRVVLLSSAAVAVAPPRQSTYVAAKAGLEGAARVAAKELARDRITVNVVRPGATDTATLRAGTSEKAIEAMTASNAMRRLGQPDDIAGIVAFLCSPDAGWLTGTVLDATGGLT